VRCGIISVDPRIRSVPSAGGYELRLYPTVARITRETALNVSHSVSFQERSSPPAAPGDTLQVMIAIVDGATQSPQEHPTVMLFFSGRDTYGVDAYVSLTRIGTTYKVVSRFLHEG
jgi:hypothetical protein